MRFLPDDEAAAVANVVVDGSPNEGTVLTLSHWPGLPAPEHTWADTSAEMVARYLDAGGGLHGDAEVVTNNHFDQDGLVGIFFLVEPEAAAERRELLLDVARCGDFAVCWARRAARVSMVVSAWANDAASVGEGLADALDRFTDLLDHPRRYKAVWDEEDRALSESQAAINAGRVSFEEVPDLDLAVVTIDPALDLPGGHRFGGNHEGGVHPMALHHATRCCRLLLLHGERYRYVDRYETWVQYRSRPLPRRTDRAPLAAELGGSSTPPSGLTPALWGEADPAVVRAAVEHHLRTAPPAWDPYEAAQPRSEV